MKFVVQFLIGIPKTMFGGYVLSKLWAWFVVGSLGLPPISAMQGVGLMFITGFFQATVIAAILGELKMNADKPAWHDVTVSALWILVLYPLTLGMGYLWHLAIVNWS